MVDEAGTLLWTDDHRPDVPPAAWGAEPVTYRRTMFVPRMASAGRVRVEAGSVRAPGRHARPFDRRAQGQPVVPGGSFDVLPPSDGLFVSFGDGWHGAERAPQEPPREWRWSTGDARLSFRHPGPEVTLWLELDQPVAAAGRSISKCAKGERCWRRSQSPPGRGTSAASPCRQGRAPGRRSIST